MKECMCEKERRLLEEECDGEKEGNRGMAYIYTKTKAPKIKTSHRTNIDLS